MKTPNKERPYRGGSVYTELIDSGLFDKELALRIQAKFWDFYDKEHGLLNQKDSFLNNQTLNKLLKNETQLLNH